MVSNLNHVGHQIQPDMSQNWYSYNKQFQLLKKLPLQKIFWTARFTITSKIIKNYDNVRHSNFSAIRDL